MANTNENSSWETIQGRVRDTERLIGQRDYNSAMMKARQTLEFMVKQLAERSGVPEGDLKEQIDALYENGKISKLTCEHYHKIRMIGNKAVHEGDNNAYNANQAYHMLSQEIYTFANDYNDTKKPSRSKAEIPPKLRVKIKVPQTDSPKPSSDCTDSDSVKSTSGQTDGNSLEQPDSSSASQSHRQSPVFHFPLTIYDMMKLMIPVLCIILLFFMVKLFGPEHDDGKPQKEQVTTEAGSGTSDMEPSDENAGTSKTTYKTTATLNVRPEPSTDTERIGQLPAGTAVEYVRAHDDEWAVILYNGQEAYVASRYLTTGQE